ncbi:MAG: thiF [Gemmatimonadetes bacterium]|nr:thiF [Gemmatimonadota bacterium]
MMPFLTEGPVDVAALVRQVEAPDRGAIVTFLGTVRNHHTGRSVERLEYHAYGAMAEAECGRILAEAERRWPCRAALSHRTGTLAIGDVAVAIAVGAAHRDEAFAACRSVIEELKRRVPIWKRELYQDGSEAWVDPTAPQGIVPAAEPR